MTKFSLYELLSYIIPGFVILKIVEAYFSLYGHKNILFEGDNLDDNIVKMFLSMLLGILLQVVTIFSINRINFYQKLIHKPISYYVNKSNELIKIYGELRPSYFKIREISDKELQDKVDQGDIFDLAYYYLEVADKSTQAKSFQSFYFLFRNIFTIMIMNLFPFIIIFSFTQNENLFIFNFSRSLTIAIYVVIYIMLAFLIILVANHMRSMMIKRVFWHYYTLLHHGPENFK